MRSFWEKHAGTEQALKSCYAEVYKARWQSSNDLKSDYPSASILGFNRVVFNINGNNYRLIVRINYEVQICWIRFVGTHAEYGKVDANTI